MFKDNDITKKNICDNLREINGVNIYKFDGCKSQFELYRGINPYKFYLYIFLDKHYIKSLVDDTLYNSLKYFIAFLLLFIGLFWLLLEQVIVTPLEQLRQYAYYSTSKPKEFFIKEFESIRYSLYITFERLKRATRAL